MNPTPSALCLVLSCMLGHTAPSFAETGERPDAESAATLSPIRVAANPLGLTSDLMALPALVLDGQQLLIRRQGTLGDTLNGLPGVHADTFGGGASRPVIRGQTAPRVKVVSDGSDLMDASAISPDHAITIEPLLADRIEVLRGPSTLLFGGGAIGGVVNVLDRRIPTAIPERGIEADAEIRGATGTGERSGTVGITAGAGELAVRVEGLRRRTDDYRVPDWSSKTLAGSYSESSQGSLGLSWVTPRGYVGAAFTYLDSKYGLPGHSHEYEDCHPHGSHLHCGGHHDHDEEHDHGHEHEHGDDQAPYVKLRSQRVDVRAGYTDPFAGVEEIRFRGGLTDYQHQEIEHGEVATTFKNRGYDARLELVHKPLYGWHGVIGLQNSFSNFRADGEEAFLPRSDTRATGLFVLEEYRWRDWRFELGARHDWQRISPEGGNASTHQSGTSLSAAAIWDFAPAYSIALSLARSQRLPTAQELYADGVHLATNTYEIGNASLGKETSHNIDLTLRKHEGDTTFSVSAFHNRIHDYIYARTLDRFEDFRLIEYAQHDAEFTGIEGEVNHQFTSVWSAGVYGDYVRGKLSSGDGNLPRIPAARLGVRVNAKWQAWAAGVEYAHVFRQSQNADDESSTAGYEMLNAMVSYRGRWDSDVGYEVYLRGTNLLDRLAYNHASFLATSAPLAGRSVLLGARVMY